ncbi:acyltransferase family protein [Agrilactobacillus yilanensis]|uniref:Acyltransferase family protein n=1 Tax=Agrilactobacillus yilanensis TaxID=2485997 RepID=A0ABW4J926_9LACO|nr:acyltransferase family protein [Agrilactobacillus yilanensis]
MKLFERTDLRLTKRVAWIDIAKAIGIILVVINHAYPLKDTFYKTTYWWHMPLFFLIGGFFLKSLHQKDERFSVFLKTKVWPLLRDYLIAGSLVILANFIIEGQSFSYLLNYFLKLLYGGDILTGYTSVFWFVSVYILALMAVTIIITYIPWRWLQFGLVTGLFILGTAYKSAESTLGRPLPWNADVALMAIFYMWIGQFSFKYLKRVLKQRLFLGVTLSLATFFIALQGLGAIDQTIYMKSHNITNGWFAMIVPLVCCFAALALAYWLQFTGVHATLELIGQHTMAIMFAHKALFFLLKKGDFQTWAVLSAAGIILPLMAVIFGQWVKAYYADRQYQKLIFNY